MDQTPGESLIASSLADARPRHAPLSRPFDQGALAQRRRPSTSGTLDSRPRVDRDAPRSQAVHGALRFQGKQRRLLLGEYPSTSLAPASAHDPHKQLLTMDATLPANAKQPRPSGPTPSLPLLTTTSKSMRGSSNAQPLRTNAS